MSRRRVLGRATLAAGLIAALVIWAPAQTATAATLNGEQLDYAKKMSPGQNIGYKIFPGNEYTSTIPGAISMLMYPPGSLSNPLVLWQTTVTANSQMDFYQYNDPGDGRAAVTSVWFKDSNGNGEDYIKMAPIQMDWYNWRYAEVRMNDAMLDPMSTSKRKLVVLHEMLHGYGLRDLVTAANKPRVMYQFMSGWTATGLTAAENAVLVAKY